VVRASARPTRHGDGYRTTGATAHGAPPLDAYGAGGLTRLATLEELKVVGLIDDREYRTKKAKL
jgi:hypothetical protein